MKLDDRTTDGQADTHALRLGGVEGGKNPLGVCAVQTVAVVGDGDFEHAAIDNARLQQQLTAVDRHVAHGFDAVLDQVEQHLLDHNAIHIDARQVFRQVDNDLRTSALGLDVGKGAGFVDQFGQGDGLPLGIVLPDHVAHAADDLAGPLGLAGGFLHGDEQVVQLVVAGLHALDAAGAVVGDGRQRLVQLMGQRGGHLAHGDQARGLLQALLLLQVDLVDVLAVGDVGRHLNAHGAAVHPADGTFVQVVPVAGQGVLDFAVVDFAGELVTAEQARVAQIGVRRRATRGGDQFAVAADGIEAVDVLESAIGKEDFAGFRISNVNRLVEAVEYRGEAFVRPFQFNPYPLGFGDVVHRSHPADLLAVGVDQWREIEADVEALAILAHDAHLETTGRRLAGQRGIDVVLQLVELLRRPVGVGWPDADEFALVEAGHPAESGADEGDAA